VIKFIEPFLPPIFAPSFHLQIRPTRCSEALSKTYYARKAGIDPAKIVTVSVMPCTAKKFECDRPEMRGQRL